MWHLRLFIYIYIFSQAILLNSCEDKDDNKYSAASHLVPESITITGDNGISADYRFNYDDNKILTGWTKTVKDSISEQIYTYIIIYDNDNIGSVKEIYGNQTILRQYNYEDNTVRVEIYGNDESVPEEYTISTNGFIQSRYYITEQWDGNNYNLSYHTTDYDYSGNNITGFLTYIDSAINERNVISYNGITGIFRNVNTPQWFLFTQIDMDEPFIRFNIYNNFKILETDKYDSEGKNILSFNVLTVQYTRFNSDFPTEANGILILSDKNNSVTEKSFIYSVKYTTAQF